MTDHLHIRKLETRDAADISNLHYESFKNFFLTSLGGGFLKVFYEEILSNPKGLGVGIFDNHSLIGFAIGTKNNEGFYKSIVKSRGIKLLAKALPYLIFSPSKMKRLFVALLSSKDEKYSQLPCLLSICVSSNIGIKGVGSRLINEFESLLLLDNCHELILTTDKNDNDYVNKFYKRNNYDCVQSFFQGKREMNLYYKKLKI